MPSSGDRDGSTVSASGGRPLSSELVWLGGIALGLAVGLWLWRVGLPPSGDLARQFRAVLPAAVGLALLARVGEWLADVLWPSWRDSG